MFIEKQHVVLCTWYSARTDYIWAWLVIDRREEGVLGRFYNTVCTIKIQSGAEARVGRWE